jgi:hypothetical protein
MANRVKVTPLNLGVQEYALKVYWPIGIVKVVKSYLQWVGEFSPTPISPQYKVLLRYTLNSPPEIFILKPSLIKNDAGKLPHVYSVDDQKLCLHFPPEKKWQPNKLLATVIMPWIAEWLYFYEIWVATTSWKGGGTHKEDVNYTDIHYVN